MADDDYSYLSGLSEHAGRAGDTSNLNPDFASRLANAIRQARAQGLNVGLMSGYRDDKTTGSAYDAGGNSSHGYGLASDISGLDGPNGKVTQAWAQIAAANGLHNPYGVGNTAEFNHWQLPPQPLEKTPQLLASLKEARATGSFPNVWSAYSGADATPPAASTNSLVASRDPTPLGTTINATQPTPALGGDHAAFIRAYAQSKGVDPNLALGIAGAEGLKAWSAKNPNAGSTVDVDPSGTPFSYGDFQLNIHPGAMGSKAIAAGIDPTDPKQWQSADRFAIDQMAAGGVGPWKGDPVAAAYLKSGAVPSAPAGSGPIDPSILARGGYSPPIPGDAATPGTTLNSPLVAASAAGSPFMTGMTNLEKAAGGKGQADASGQGQDQPIRPSPMVGSAVGARNVSPLMGNPQAYLQLMAGLSQPMQIGQGPPGQNPWAGVGIQPPQQSPGAPFGLSLASALYDPSMGYMGNGYG